VCSNEVRQLAVIEEFKLNREELEKRIKSLEEEISHRAELNKAQLEQQDLEQIEGKNKCETVLFMFIDRHSNITNNVVPRFSEV